MNLEEIIASFCNYQQEVAIKLLHLSQSAVEVQIKLRQCKVERARLLQTILHNKARALTAASILKFRKRRSTWTFARHGSFWEKDVPSNNDAFFKESFRMERSNFNVLVEQLKLLERKDTHFRKCIPLAKRVAIALYALGSSAEYRTVGLLFGVSKASVCNILNEFCREVWRVLAPIYLKSDFLTEDKVRECVEGFQILGFPQCLGAMDGCHVEVRPSTEDAVDYFNYKGWYSTILFALVDHRYRFMFISVGTPGRCNDSSIFEQSSLKPLLQNEILKDNSININGTNVPVVVLGDSAFRLSECVMKPYAFSTSSSKKQKSFNYALSKCRRVVENAFGHLKARFRRIGKGIDNKLVNVNAILKCACVLHNFLNENNSDINNTWIEEQAERDKSHTNHQPHNTIFLADFNRTAEEIRSAIATFLCSEDDGDCSE